MEDDREFVYKSDISPAEGRKRIDPKTGAFYITHLKESDTTGRAKSKVGGGKNIGDIYNDPFSEFGQKRIPYTKKELDDFNTVTKEYIVNNPALRNSVYWNQEIPENRPEPVSGKITRRGRHEVVEDDPFFSFHGDLRHLIRSHQYVLAVTVKLSPKIMALKYAKEFDMEFPEPRQVGYIKNELKQCGAVCNNQEEIDLREAVSLGLADKEQIGRVENEDTGIVMLSFQFSELYEGVQEQPKLEDELVNLNLKTVTPFIEDRLVLRLLLVPVDIHVYPRSYHMEKFFFSVT